MNGQQNCHYHCHPDYLCPSQLPAHAHAHRSIAHCSLLLSPSSVPAHSLGRKVIECQRQSVLSCPSPPAADSGEKLARLGFISFPATVQHFYFPLFSSSSSSSSVPAPSPQHRTSFSWVVQNCCRCQCSDLLLCAVSLPAYLCLCALFPPSLRC